MIGLGGLGGRGGLGGLGDLGGLGLLLPNPPNRLLLLNPPLDEPPDDLRLPDDDLRLENPRLPPLENPPERPPPERPPPLPISISSLSTVLYNLIMKKILFERGHSESAFSSRPVFPLSLLYSYLSGGAAAFCRMARRTLAADRQPVIEKGGSFYDKLQKILAAAGRDGAFPVPADPDLRRQFRPAGPSAKE